MLLSPSVCMIPYLARVNNLFEQHVCVIFFEVTLSFGFHFCVFCRQAPLYSTPQHTILCSDLGLSQGPRHPLVRAGTQGSKQASKLINTKGIQ